MPFTPFHFGPGLLVKSLIPRRMSFTGFVASQVTVDTETLYHLLRHIWPAHGPAHSLLGGSVVGIATGALCWIAAKPWLPKIARLEEGRTPAQRQAIESELSFAGLVAGGFIGGASHSVIDGAMHFDVYPLWPFSKAQPWLGYINGEGVMAVCVAAGIVACVILWSRLSRRETAL